VKAGLAKQVEEWSRFCEYVKAKLVDVNCSLAMMSKQQINGFFGFIKVFTW
jgi:hypothetical protein